MTDDRPDLAAIFGLPQDHLAAIDRIAAFLEVQAADLLRMMVARVIRMETRLTSQGLPGIHFWKTKSETVTAVKRVETDGGSGAWATSIGLPGDQAKAFDTIATSLNVAPAEIIKLMVARAVGGEKYFGQPYLAAIGLAGTKAKIAEDVTDWALNGLPVNIKETGFMWPEDAPFPWSAEECRAAVLGYKVRWPGDFNDFFERLRGLWEMSDGYGFLLQR